MIRLWRTLLCPLAVCTLSSALNASAAPRAAESDAMGLRLAPFPKVVQLMPGEFRLPERARIVISELPAARQAASDLATDLKTAAGVSAGIAAVPASGSQSMWVLILADGGVDSKVVASQLGRLPAEKEGYRLVVSPDFAAVGAAHSEGLACGIQTLRQLVRANLRGRTLPALSITDWPSLQYRGFQDDITRGPSPKLETLEREVRMGQFLRMNFFTYYLEHQFQFSKNPVIGPKDGSLTPSELADLVRYARAYSVEIVGCQQSFGHFYHILKHEEYKDLSEGGDCLSPTNERAYNLLDEMYSEQIPLLDSKLFNVCCDETYELGTGPSKELAQKIGVGGVYARHMKRVHDLVTGKYGKRMMMWGDIILQHPENLDAIPRDTIMLSWGYHPGESFEPAIVPFVRSGFYFFVCPGTSCWGRILPDFQTAITNIGNYVRDGAKHGAMGMLNTTWVDDGETLFPYNWHGIAWGAECAWNASTTRIEDFNRRIGGVIFGEKGDHFGQAIMLLAKTHTLPGYDAMMDPRFWRADFGELPANRAAAVRQANALLDVVEPALRHLRLAKADALFNIDILDYFIFGAERMKLMATRWLDFLKAADAYQEAVLGSSRPANARSLLKDSARILTRLRDQHVETKERYRELWNREKKPYALDWTLARFDALIGQYDKLISGVARADAALLEGRSLPTASEIGLQISELGVRRTQPSAMLAERLLPDAQWSEEGYGRRVGVVISAGDIARRDQPIELDLPTDVSGATRLMEVDPADGAQRLVAGQIERAGKSHRLVFIAPGETPAGGKRCFFLYHAATSQAAETVGPSAVSCVDGPGGAKWVGNDRVKLLIGPEGGHIYRWEVKDLGNLDLTHPGEADWAGFADVIGVQRNWPNKIEVEASGPVLVRLKCTGAAGMVKTFSIWAGVPWIEVTFDAPTGWFATYDDINIMGADSRTPGMYLFDDGETGPIRKTSSGLECQARKPNTHWSAKYVKGGAMLSLITPETATLHYAGPGGGMGGVGIESSTAAAHFVLYGGICPDFPRSTLGRLWATLDYRRQPRVDVYQPEQRARRPEL